MNRFTDAQGVKHYPGEIVDLPTSYLGETWLEPVEKPKKAVAPPAKLEPEAPMPTPAPVKSEAPLEPRSTKKSKS